jgi:hypothetical protein
MSGNLLLIRLRETWSPDGLAHAPCFSGSCAGLITGFTCGTFDLKLVTLDVVDCVHDTSYPGVRQSDSLAVLVLDSQTVGWLAVPTSDGQLSQHN